jgi:hypothetical protein
MRKDPACGCFVHDAHRHAGTFAQYSGASSDGTRWLKGPIADKGCSRQ